MKKLATRGVSDEAIKQLNILFDRDQVMELADQHITPEVSAFIQMQSDPQMWELEESLLRSKKK